MKIFFKILGYIILTILVLAYVAFLFVLPKKIDLNIYKEDLQKLVTEKTNLNLNIDNVELFTTPLLQAGIKINDINVKLPDGSDLTNIERISGKVSIPHLLILNVKVSEIKIDNPEIDIEIEKDGSQYKIMNIVQQIINEQKQQQEVTPPPEAEIQKFQFNPEWIRITVPNVKISNYKVLVNDLKSKHYLTLKGDELFASMHNLKKFRVKTNAQILSDENVNINANIDIDSFIPKFEGKDTEDDPDYRSDMSFTNPVLLYRDYDLKTNIDTKLKIRTDKNGQISINGHNYINDLTMNLSGYQLPYSYLKTDFNKNKFIANTNINYAKNQTIKINGMVNYGKSPKLNLDINSDRIYFKDVIMVTKALMDTLHIKNDLNNITSSGYFKANASVKTDFKKLNSNGAIIIRNGKIANNDIGLKNINANVLFNKDNMQITNTSVDIDNSKLIAEGSIDKDSSVNLFLHGNDLPLPSLFRAFGPVDLRKSIKINTGNIDIDTKITGTLDKILSDINFNLKKLNVSTPNNNLIINDELFTITATTDLKNISAKINNKGLNINVPGTKSNISNSDAEIVIDSENITIKPIIFKINDNSTIFTLGNIYEYIKNPQINIDLIGKFKTADLKQFTGELGKIFIDAKGSIPVKVAIQGTPKRQDIRVQILANNNNYITPIVMEPLLNKTSIIQAIIHYKGNRLNIKDTGIFVKDGYNEFVNDFEENISNASQLVKINGTISKLNTLTPFINQIRFAFTDDINASIYAFKNSSLQLGGNLLVYGQSSSPKYQGLFKISNLRIPELYTSIQNIELDFATKILNLKLDNILLNKSDINVIGSMSLEDFSNITINRLNINSNNFDIEDLTKVTTALPDYLPKSSATQSSNTSNIPVQILNGNINFKNIIATPIKLTNTTGNISLFSNIFYLNNLNTSTFEGVANGDVSVNLLTLLIKAEILGQNFNIEKALLEMANLKDAITGKTSFITDLEIDGSANSFETQIKGIKGLIDFEISKGQLGPFGHLENMILAENIRESEFFQTALGGVINNLTSIETSHYDRLNGHIIINDGIVNLEPITSLGPVMCLKLSGNMNILNNQADMQLRARLGSRIADMLGPIAAVNPINLVKATPGLNVAAAKMFAFFCEEITPEEMNEIPQFADDFGTMSTTNFQIILRGDVQKPLSLIKSFKWLATSADMNAAKDFVETLPPPDETNPNATLEEIQAKIAEEERLKNENAIQKSTRKFKDFLNKFKKKDAQ